MAREFTVEMQFCGMMDKCPARCIYKEPQEDYWICTAAEECTYKIDKKYKLVEIKHDCTKDGDAKNGKD